MSEHICEGCRHLEWNDKYEKENAELKETISRLNKKLLSGEGLLAGARLCSREDAQLIAKLKAKLEKAKDALKFTLFFAEYVTQPDKELEKGMAPFFYHTLTYEGDLELIERVKQIRQTLAELESK